MLTIQNFTAIHPEAKIGDNVHIDPFTTIHKNVEIGDDTWIGSNVTIMEGARIGKNCKIFPGAVISAITQDLKFKGEESYVVIGDNTTIREYVTINRGTAEFGITTIGNNCNILAYSHVAHDCSIGNNTVLSNNTTLAGHVIIGENVVISGLTAINQFSIIGDYAFIAGGSQIRKDIPPYIKAGRNPLCYLGINNVGLRRNGFSENLIKNLQSIYKIIFQNKMNVSQAIDILENKFEKINEKQKIIEFIKKSERGILKGYN